MNELQDWIDQIFDDFRYPKLIIAGACIELAFIMLCVAALVKYVFF